MIVALGVGNHCLVSFRDRPHELGILEGHIELRL